MRGVAVPHPVPLQQGLHVVFLGNDNCPLRAVTGIFHSEHQQHVSHVGHRKAPHQFPLDALKHFAVFTEQLNVVDIKGQDVDGAASGVDVDTRVRLEDFETDLHHVFVDRAIPGPWALPETIKTFEKPHYHWNSVVTEFLVSGCHFNVNVLFDFGIQKSGVVIKLPALKVVLQKSDFGTFTPLQTGANVPPQSTPGTCPHPSTTTRPL